MSQYRPSAREVGWGEGANMDVVDSELYVLPRRAARTLAIFVRYRVGVDGSATGHSLAFLPHQ